MSKKRRTKDTWMEYLSLGTKIESEMKRRDWISTKIQANNKERTQNMSTHNYKSTLPPKTFPSHTKQKIKRKNIEKKSGKTKSTREAQKST